ncbi:PREDICTED: uncharacterized protein LOC105569675 [Vollenhovia emeryi]|uniref:uncharacterized protein LOC105569675 n=1 Tax=Vollenhovia emeryi TaxID=411798 RepID=UPI0005F4DDA3|nr:PREDICTED: uncharacterized protein LOC105569675 [Vollenhovia emeryi]
MACLKSTRKTYSFEERKLLISLINKHDVIQDRKLDPISMCKRKSAWKRIAEEYNLTVGSQGARTAVQLKRCWENMKACKRNHEEKKLRDNTKVICQTTKDKRWARNQCWEGITCSQNMSEAAVSTGNGGLPPNVVFEPKDSEPFTLQSVCTAGSQNPNCLKKDADSRRDLNFDGVFKQIIADRNKHVDIAPPSDSVDDYFKRFVTKRNLNSPTIGQSTENNKIGKVACREIHANAGPSDLYTSISPCVVQGHNRNGKSMQREEELHVLALSEAQMKVDIAAMLKEEARIKLEEAHYRKEEARLKMLFFTYKLNRIKNE